MTDYNTPLDGRSPTDTPPEHWANPTPYRSRTEALEAVAEILRWTTRVLTEGIMPNTTRPTMALEKLDAMYRHELAGVEAVADELTQAEYADLLGSSSAASWARACKRVKDAHGGYYPADWHERIVEPGIMRALGVDGMETL